MANFNINPGLMQQLSDPYRGRAAGMQQGFDRGLQMGLLKKEQERKQQRQQIADAYKMIDTASSVLSKGKKLPKETKAMYSQILSQGYNVLAQHWNLKPISPGAELDDEDQTYIDELNALTNSYTKGEIGSSAFRQGYTGIVRRAEEEGEIKGEGAKRLVKQIEEEQGAKHTGLLQGAFPQQGAQRTPQQLQRSFSEVAPSQYLKFQGAKQKAGASGKKSNKALTEFRLHTNALDSLYRNIDPITKAIIGVEDQEKQIEARKALMQKYYPKQSKIYFKNRDDKTGKPKEQEKKLKPMTSAIHKIIKKDNPGITQQEAIEIARKMGYAY